MGANSSQDQGPHRAKKLEFRKKFEREIAKVFDTRPNLDELIKEYQCCDIFNEKYEFPKNSNGYCSNEYLFFILAYHGYGHLCVAHITSEYYSGTSPCTDSHYCFGEGKSYLQFALEYKKVTIAKELLTVNQTQLSAKDISTIINVLGDRAVIDQLTSRHVPSDHYGILSAVCKNNYGNIVVAVAQSASVAEITGVHALFSPVSYAIENKIERVPQILVNKIQSAYRTLGITDGLYRRTIEELLKEAIQMDNVEYMELLLTTFDYEKAVVVRLYDKGSKRVKLVLSKRFAIADPLLVEAPVKIEN
jgi:hypothetical protein